MSKAPTLELTQGQEAPAGGAAAPEAPKADNIVIDSTGRVLKLAELDVLAESRLIRLVGADAAINQAYMQLYVAPAMAVVEIDAEPMPLPQTQLEIDAAISRLGHHGINAVIAHWAKQREDKAVQAAKAAAEKAALKN